MQAREIRETAVHPIKATAREVQIPARTTAAITDMTATNRPARLQEQIPVPAAIKVPAAVPVPAVIQAQEQVQVPAAVRIPAPATAVHQVNRQYRFPATTS